MKRVRLRQGFGAISGHSEMAYENLNRKIARKVLKRASGCHGLKQDLQVFAGQSFANWGFGGFHDTLVQAEGVILRRTTKPEQFSWIGRVCFANIIVGFWSGGE